MENESFSGSRIRRMYRIKLATV